MLLGFKRKFAPFVQDGTKTHTIRLGRATRPRVGETCHCYVDPRRKTMRLLGRWLCTAVQDIRVIISNDPLRVEIWIDGSQLGQDEVNEFCWRDGFRPNYRRNAWFSFATYWSEIYGFKQFDGLLIHWDYRKTTTGAGRYSQ